MNERLEKSIEIGRKQGNACFYFGCLGHLGHFLYNIHGHSVYGKHMPSGFPWDEALMDAGLLINGKRPDVVDGKVYWTCGGAEGFWYAFYWWDRSVDKRGRSNSGFYVRGFGYQEAQEAFDYACAQFPSVVARQACPLVLQNPRFKTAGEGEQQWVK